MIKIDNRHVFLRQRDNVLLVPNSYCLNNVIQVGVGVCVGGVGVCVGVGVLSVHGNCARVCVCMCVCI